MCVMFACLMPGRSKIQFELLRGRFKVWISNNEHEDLRLQFGAIWISLQLEVPSNEHQTHEHCGGSGAIRCRPGVSELQIRTGKFSWKMKEKHATCSCIRSAIRAASVRVLGIRGPSCSLHWHSIGDHLQCCMLIESSRTQVWHIVASDFS